ncbi:MAG: rRNA maturation RNase YbeY [Eubacteriales bacterium]|nr:rRNA maturation RNase YbeY [Eubacteriales bacterium]
MSVRISNDQSKIKIDANLKKIIKKSAELCLKQESFDYKTDINILITDDPGIRELNRKFRNIDKETDVLSFPMSEMKNGKANPALLEIDMENGAVQLGDIAISAEKASSQASEYGHSLEREMAFLATHGVYHLLGFEHDKDRSAMFEKQESVLGSMGIAREKNGK